MVATSTFIVAASSLFALTFSAPIPSTSLAQRAIYKNYGGDGSASKGWPIKKDWKPFEELWKANLKTLGESCKQFGEHIDNNSDAEINAIKKAIEDGSSQTKIDARVILALVMQESKGCVRAPTTNYGHDNPGLMQSFEGSASCNRGNVVTSPCPDETIRKQIFEGLGLEGRPFGLSQAWNKADPTRVLEAQGYYRAARIYNSGTAVDANLGQGIATHCYASDIANRLLGWASDQTSCQEATIGSYGGTSGQVEQGNTQGNTETTQPQPQPQPTQSNTNPNTNTNTNGDSNPTAPKAPGAASSCKTWYTVKAGDTCSSTGHESALRNLNQLDANCGNLWLGYAYCIAQ